MEQEDFLRQSVGHQLGRAYNLFWRACAARLRPHRLTPKQFSLLSLICRQPGISQSELCVRTVSKPPQVVGLLEALGQRKLVRRRTEKNDRRRRRWYPTAAGIEREKILRQKVTAAEAEVCAACGLDTRRRTALFRLLSEINERSGGNGAST